MLNSDGSKDLVPYTNLKCENMVVTLNAIKQSSQSSSFVLVTLVIMATFCLLIWLSHCLVGSMARISSV